MSKVAPRPGSRDAAGQSPDRLELLALAKLRIEGHLAGDVAGNLDRSDGNAVLVAERDHVRVDVEGRPIRPSKVEPPRPPRPARRQAWSTRVCRASVRPKERPIPTRAVRSRVRRSPPGSGAGAVPTGGRCWIIVPLVGPLARCGPVFALCARPGAGAAPRGSAGGGALGRGGATGSGRSAGPGRPGSGGSRGPCRPRRANVLEEIRGGDGLAGEDGAASNEVFDGGALGAVPGQEDDCDR